MNNQRYLHLLRQIDELQQRKRRRFDEQTEAVLAARAATIVEETPESKDIAEVTAKAEALANRITGYAPDVPF